MQKISFPSKVSFDDELRNRIDNYFKENGESKFGTLGLKIKAISILVSMFSIYYFLVFKTENIYLAIFLTFLLVQTQILIAFNVMHDGGHGSFSKKSWINQLAVLSMDLIGASSSLWKQKHNNLHHTYTNIDGKDDDIDIGNMMRLSPNQAIKPWHKYQHVYAPFLYGFLSLYMLFFTDFKKIISQKIGDTPLVDHGIRKSSLIVFAKILYLTYTLFIPMLFHSPLIVIGLFLFGHFILGLTLSIVFQLAHTVNETKFPTPDENGKLPLSWVEHQLSTTSNFARDNKFITFYCGGLNYQVEHHIFHKISHVHYPKISKIVQNTCEEYGKPYFSSPGFFSALKSHFSFLKNLGTQ